MGFICWFSKRPFFDISNLNYILYFIFIGRIFECEAGASESVGNLVDPCYFPTPHYINFPSLCQYQYHQVGFVCDPLALLSRTEAELLNKRFENFSLSGCVDCKTTVRRGCVPEDAPNNARISLLIVPYTNTQRIESCVAGRFRNSRYTASEAARSYTEMVQRNWAESGCGADITILYIGSMHNPLTNIRQPHPFIVRLFSNNLAHLSQMSSVKMVNAEQGIFESLYLELNHSLSIAHIDNRFSGTPKYIHKTHSGVPLWAFEICAFLLVLVLITLYLGNCVVRRFDTRAQKKSNGARSAALLSSQNSNNAVNGANERWAGSSSAANQNTSLTSNLAIQNTKSSMMFRQFSAHASKKQQDRAKAGVQKI